MSEETNLNDQYKNIVENEESAAQEQATDLGKVNMDRFKPAEAQEAELVLGYHAINVTHLPSAGMFYPEDIKINVRSAKVSEIRHFSSIDETNVFDADDKLNYILEACTQITSAKKRLSYKDILEEDRFFLILSIRDITFPEPESKLTIDHLDKKGEKHQVEIKKDYFTYFKVPETLDKYYDSERKTFMIETKSFGTIRM